MDEIDEMDEMSFQPSMMDEMIIYFASWFVINICDFPSHFPSYMIFHHIFHHIFRTIQLYIHTHTHLYLLVQRQSLPIFSTKKTMGILHFTPLKTNMTGWKISTVFFAGSIRIDSFISWMLKSSVIR